MTDHTDFATEGDIVDVLRQWVSPDGGYVTVASDLVANAAYEIEELRFITAIVNDLRSASNEPTEAILVSSDLLIEAADEIDRLRQLITAWADAYKGANVAIGGFNDDIEAYTDACDALRKAVGR